MELRDALRLLRSETGLTQVELSNQLNVGFSTVSRWENQNTRPNRAGSVAIMNLARDRHVSSTCLDELGRILFAPRADDKGYREAANKVTELLKLERRLLLTSEQLKTAIDNIDVGIIAQRFHTKPSKRTEAIYYNSFFSSTLGYTDVEFAEKLNQHLYFAIEPEYRAKFIQRFEDLLARRIGMKDFTIILRMARKDGTLLWAEIKAIALHEYSYGQELFTSCRDVTEREESKRAFQEEVAYREVTLVNCYATFHCDLTANEIIRERDSSALIGYTDLKATADGILSAVANAAPAGEDREKFSTVFSRKAMLEAFSAGETSRSLFLFNNIGRHWLRMEYHLVKNPSSGHIVALVYSYDVQKQMLSMKMMDAITERFFDYIGYIDIATGIYETLYASEKSWKQPFAERGSYMEALDRQKRLHADPECAEDDYRAMALPYVVKMLSRQNFYTRAHRVRRDDGGIVEKKTVFTFLDETRKQIVAAQCDTRFANDILTRIFQKQGIQ